MESFSPLNLNDNETQSYLLELSEFLAKYSWVYDVKNTDMFVADVVEKIPDEWKGQFCNLTVEELNKIPYGLIKDDWPSSLKSFINTSNKLGKIRYPEFRSNQAEESNIVIPKCVKKKTPLKKQQEIIHAAVLIGDICKKFDCSIVLDIGSGLGYLDEVMHLNFGVVCIGLDSISRNTTSAKLRLEKSSSRNSIRHETLLVEDTANCRLSLTLLLSSVSSKLIKYSQTSVGKEKQAVIMVGLHCCGKLPHDMMKLFCSMAEIKAFVCLGCCYHLMDEKEFPISNTVQLAISSAQKLHPSWLPCKSGFRLGAQYTRKCWASLTSERHYSQEKHLLFRAVLQNYMHNENITKWRKPKRRIRNSCLSEFGTYCTSMLQDATWTESEKKYRIEKMIELYHKKEHHLADIRILMVLQVLLQPLWEIFITLDRVLFLKENSIRTKAFVLWDNVSSPRDIAICGFKT